MLNDFKQLYIKYEKQIYKYLFFLTGDKYVAEELTQETFYQALKSIHRFKGESKVSTWLFQIAKFSFYKYAKKNKVVYPVADTSFFENQQIRGDTPEDIYDKKEVATNVLRAIQKLKQPQQEIIILRLYNELSFKEIGDIFNQSDTWARVNFYRAKNRLSSILYGGEDD